MKDVWEAVMTICTRPPSLLTFRNSFCVCRCNNCEKLPTFQHCLPCGCKLCDQCLKHESANSVSIVCPVHKKQLHLSKIKSIELKAEDIMQMEAHCKNMVNGCMHIGIIKDLKCHEEIECCFSYAKCPLKCGNEILLKDFAEHLTLFCAKRIVKCSYCNKDFMQNTKEIHNKMCTMFPVSCQYCRMDLKRYLLPQHEEFCDQKPVLCKFREMGCKFSDKRINMSQHEALENHTNLFLSTFRDLNEIKNEAQLQLDSMNQELQIMRNTIEDMKEQSRSLLDTEDSFEELKNFSEWTKEKVETLEKQLVEVQEVTTHRDSNIQFSPFSAKFRSLARLDFKRVSYCSTPKPKKTKISTEDNYIRFTEDIGTQTVDLNEDDATSLMEETKRKEIDEQTTGQAESQPISSSTELIYPKSTTKTTIFMCIVLAVLLIASVVSQYVSNYPVLEAFLSSNIM